MFAAVRSGAGWLLIGTAMGLAGCSAIPLPEIPIPMPALPGFGPQPIAAELEPVPLAPAPAARQPAQEGASLSAPSDRPAFFVQWQADMPGMTRRPAIAPGTPLPDYPEAAMRKEEAGVTALESCVTVDGRLADVKLAKSSGSPTLDGATLAWAVKARFTPAEFDGQPMAVCGYRLDYEWRVAPDR